MEKIDPERWYTLYEILAAKWITNTLGKDDRRYLLRLIHTDRLLARNFAFGDKLPRWKVQGSELIKYLT